MHTVKCLASTVTKDEYVFCGLSTQYFKQDRVQSRGAPGGGGCQGAALPPPPGPNKQKKKKKTRFFEKKEKKKKK